jgi:hypothetical protein
MPFYGFNSPGTQVSKGPREAGCKFDCIKVSLRNACGAIRGTGGRGRRGLFLPRQLGGCMTSVKG